MFALRFVTLFRLRYMMFSKLRYMMELTSVLTAVFLTSCFFGFLENTEIGEAMVESSKAAELIAFCIMTMGVYYMIKRSRKNDEALVPLDILSIVLSEFTIFFFSEKELNIGPYPAVKLIITIIALFLYNLALKEDNTVIVCTLDDSLNALFIALDFVLAAWLIYNTVKWSFINFVVAFVIGVVIGYGFTGLKISLFE